MEVEEQKKTLFIITRHINSLSTSQLWKNCFFSIKRLYPHSEIIIIDNGSDEKYIENDPHLKVVIIKSDIPKSHFYVGYYYYLKYFKQHFERACIVHDGIIFHSTIDLSLFKNVKFFWHFDSHEGDSKSIGLEMLDKIKNGNSLTDFYLSNNWSGCMGCISVIEGSFLQILEDKYNILNLSTYIDNNVKAMEFERIFAVLCHTEYPELKYNQSFFGKHTNLDWRLSFNHYLFDLHNQFKKPVIKIFGYRLD